VQFKRVFTFCVRDWGVWALCDSSLLVYAADDDDDDDDCVVPTSRACRWTNQPCRIHTAEYLRLSAMHSLISDSIRST